MMRQPLRWHVRQTPLYVPLRNAWRCHKQKMEYREWLSQGQPVPVAHIAKQLVLKDIAQDYGLRVLVETGTYYGDMVAALKNDFERIYSIELSAPLYEMARRRFRRDRSVELIHGDSGAELGRLLSRLNVPALFWLDGHYSAGETARGDCDTPIYKELQHIFDAQDFGHVIVIDDAWLFGRDPAYPSVDALRRFVSERRPDAKVVIENDSIRILPSVDGHSSGETRMPGTCLENAGVVT